MNDATISRALIIQNTPTDEAWWTIRCTCGGSLSFRCVDRGTNRARIDARHGDGEALKTWEGYSDESLFWTLGLADPIGEWVERIHEYEGDQDDGTGPANAQP